MAHNYACILGLYNKNTLLSTYYSYFVASFLNKTQYGDFYSTLKNSSNEISRTSVISIIVLNNGITFPASYFE